MIARRLTPQEFAHLGGGALAYVKTIRSEDAQRLFPQAPAIRPGLELYALLGADGTPIMLTDSRTRRSPTLGKTSCRRSACTEPSLPSPESGEGARESGR